MEISLIFLECVVVVVLPVSSVAQDMDSTMSVYLVHLHYISKEPESPPRLTVPAKSAMAEERWGSPHRIRPW